MNCKKGDLALVVGTDGASLSDAALGLVLKLGDFAGSGYWNVVDGPIVHCQSNGSLLSAKIARSQDWALRPIRDPGDEVQDEMVALVGKPPSVELAPKRQLEFAR